MTAEEVSHVGGHSRQEPHTTYNPSYIPETLRPDTSCFCFSQGLTSRHQFRPVDRNQGLKHEVGVLHTCEGR